MSGRLQPRLRGNFILVVVLLWINPLSVHSDSHPLCVHSDSLSPYDIGATSMPRVRALSGTHVKSAIDSYHSVDYIHWIWILHGRGSVSLGEQPLFREIHFKAIVTHESSNRHVLQVKFPECYALMPGTTWSLLLPLSSWEYSVFVYVRIWVVCMAWSVKSSYTPN